MSLPECPLAAIGAVLDAPEPGYFALRLGRRQPWSPAIIYSPCPFICPEHEFDGDPKDWFYPTGRALPLRAQVCETTVENAEMVLKVWQGSRGVPRWEYNFLMARRAWARKYQPDSYHARVADLRVLRNRELLG